MKIITKTVANRIKDILSSIISDNQSAFVLKRLISDDTMITYEFFNYIHSLTNKKNGHGKSL